MNLVLFLMAFGAGVAISSQAAINSRLAAALGADSVFAALVSFACGTLALAIVAAARGGLGQALANLPGQPLWKFSGGFLGAAFVFGTVFLAPRIAGALVMVAGVALTLFGDRLAAALGR